MPTNHTAYFHKRTGASAGEEPVVLLEITHPQLVQPIRVVNDTQNLTHNGNLFIGLAFEVQFPESVGGSMPRAPIAIDNVGKDLTSWLDASNGGQGASVRMIQVMRGTPDVIEQEFTLDLLGVSQDMLKVTGQLGYENVLEKPGLRATFTPETAPGLF